MTKKLPKGITQRGDKYRVSVMVDGQRKTGTADSLKEATDLRDTLVENLKAPQQAPESWTFKEAAEHYEDEHLIPNGMSTSTAYQIKSRAASFARFFGEDTKLDEITEQGLVRYLTHMKRDKDTAPSTLRNDLTTISSLMRHARKMGGMSAELPTFPKVKKTQARVRYLTPEEERSVLDYFDHIGHKDIRDIVAFLVDTGLRVNREGLSLLWENVDLKAGKVFVWKSKSARPRMVPMTERVKAILRGRWLAYGKNTKGPFMDTGYQTLREKWNQMRTHFKRDDDPGFTLHILRHTFCTRLVSGGVDLRTVQALAGHEGIETTMRYTHFIPDRMFGAISVLENPQGGERPDLQVIPGGAI